ncbi:MAG: Holliday junction branch migration protein RuvA [Clostridia bacterium]|nr:Holliday junction branch migration protein RuvA [Clostridia bacterium]
MFAYIKGSLEAKGDNYVVIETGGIGYKVFMPVSSIDKLGEIGQNVKVHTYYYVREDAINLYGFCTDEELKMFELLLSVSGIGAKSALGILAEVSPSNFAMAIITNDVSKLVKIPGIGAKTAQRMILELKDKMKTVQAVNKDEKVAVVIESEETISEAMAALQMLGYNRKEIEKVFEKIDIKNLGVEDIIRKALSVLGK